MLSHDDLGVKDKVETGEPKTKDKEIKVTKTHHERNA